MTVRGCFGRSHLRPSVDRHVAQCGARLAHVPRRVGLADPASVEVHDAVVRGSGHLEHQPADFGRATQYEVLEGRWVRGRPAVAGRGAVADHHRILG